MKNGNLDIVNIEGKNYPVDIKRNKGQKNTYLRFIKDTFFISTNLYSSDKEVEKIILEYGQKLIKRKKNVINFKTDDGLYILGEEHKADDNFIDFLGHKLLVTDLEVFYKKNKKLFYDFFLNELRSCEEKTNSKYVHDLILKNTKTLYGRNNIKTHEIMLNFSLIHYDKKIIDSVIIHEICHDSNRYHNSEFYNLVYSYCPDYDILNKKLRKGIFK